MISIRISRQNHSVVSHSTH